MVVLITPWSLESIYVWMEIGIAWYKGIRIVVLLLGVSAIEFQQKAKVPVILKRKSLLRLNDAQRYFKQLRSRIAKLSEVQNG